MKPSHITTPRTLAETTFSTGYASAQPDRSSFADRAVMWACGFAAIGVVLVVLFVPEV